MSSISSGFAKTKLDLSSQKHTEKFHIPYFNSDWHFVQVYVPEGRTVTGMFYENNMLSIISRKQKIRKHVNLQSILKTLALFITM